jgi:hypothetical protein
VLPTAGACVLLGAPGGRGTRPGVPVRAPGVAPHGAALRYHGQVPWASRGRRGRCCCKLLPLPLPTARVPSDERMRRERVWRNRRVGTRGLYLSVFSLLLCVQLQVPKAFKELCQGGTWVSTHLRAGDMVILNVKTVGAPLPLFCTRVPLGLSSSLAGTVWRQWSSIVPCAVPFGCFGFSLQICSSSANKTTQYHPILDTRW